MRSFSLSPMFSGFIVAVLLSAAVAITIPACSTTPTAAGSPPTADQQIAINAAVSIAVSVAIQNGSSDPVVWSARAHQITAIVTELEAVAAGEGATIATVTAALQPLLDKAGLTPPERIAANQLVIILGQEISTHVDTTSPQVVLIKQVLDQVNTAATAYL